MYKVNISRQGARLTRPFTMIELAYVEDFSISIYLCHGSIVWHRHIDQDELFLVHSGTISLETEVGNLILRQGELATVPKGVAHRSSSTIRSEVLLFSPKLLPDRKNGDRRTHALGGDITKVNLYERSDALARPYHPEPLAQVEDFTLSVMVCDGTSIWYERPRRPFAFIVVEGLLKLEAGPHNLLMERSDMTLVSTRYIYRFHAPRRTVALTFGRSPGAR